ncbi:transcriptional regulator [Capnocytophaga sp. oral taxon 323]|nr:transcriptional regulator [Capnocytophaga sp. oral taxon 323]
MPKFETWAKFIQKAVQGTRSDREKTSEKPPNPRRGTSLKEKLVKTIGLKDKTYLKIERN